MAYRRYTRRTKKPKVVTRTRTYRRRRPALRQQIAKMTESKYLHATYSGTQSDTATITALTMPNQGDAIGSRDGDEVLWTSIRGTLSVAAADNTNVIRFILFQWHPDTATEVPAASTVLASASTPISPFIPIRLKRSKFSVLYDRTITVSSNGNAAKTLPISVGLKKFRKTVFNQGELGGKNLIYFLILSDSGAATHPTIAFDFIYRFHDY